MILDYMNIMTSTHMK